MTLTALRTFLAGHTTPTDGPQVRRSYQIGPFKVQVVACSPDRRSWFSTGPVTRGTGEAARTVGVSAAGPRSLLTVMWRPKSSMVCCACRNGWKADPL